MFSQSFDLSHKGVHSPMPQSSRVRSLELSLAKLIDAAHQVELKWETHDLHLAVNSLIIVARAAEKVLHKP
jgi:hypothetical protein